MATPDTKTPPVPRGAFVVLEGLDRSGKTTQAKLLEQRFVEAGKPVQTMRFPDRTTPIGQMIDGYLKSNVAMDDHVIHLLFSANRWEAANKIRSVLASGTSIICDRYYHSGIVYSAAKQNPSLTLKWAHAPERGLSRPDVVVFLDLDEEQARARGGWEDEAYEKADMQMRVKELFGGLSEGGKAGVPGMEEGAWKQEADDLVMVNAGGSVEEVAERIWDKVKDRLGMVARGELGSQVRTVE